MARAIWSGSISFGLVNVPIKVVTAVSQKEVRFHNLHDADGVRLQYKRICPADGEEVPYEHIVKGYQIAPDEYVLITPDELDALAPESTRRVDIEEFVELADIDPLYYDKSYYLVPNTGGAKAYRVLLEAMRDAGKVALGRVVLRTRQHLVALRASGDALIMSTLNFADEIVQQDSLDGLPDSAADASDRELKMATQLIEALAGPFEPEKYEDEHRAKVLALIEAKAEGAEVVTQPAAKEPNLVVDLMAALEQSLNATRAEKASAGKPATRRKRPSGSGATAAGDAAAAAGSAGTAARPRVAAAKRTTRTTAKVPSTPRKR